VENWPMVAREGLVGGLLLTKVGIFYLRTKDLLLYRSHVTYEKYDNEISEEHEYAANRLSEHAYTLYKKIVEEAYPPTMAQNMINKRARQSFERLLDDCMLHMLLNDFAIALSYVKVNKKNNQKAIAAIVELMQSVTHSTPPPPTLYQRWWLRSTPSPPSGSGSSSSSSSSSSSQCLLEEWTRKNSDVIRGEIKNIFFNIGDPKLFWRDGNAWKQSNLEKIEDQQWRGCFRQTHCDWRKSIGGGVLRVELELLKPTKSSDDWENMGRLRYCINTM